jgi:hypothetical protein
MRYYLDTEFNGSGGALLSFALLREDGAAIYGIMPLPANVEPWVNENVIPILRDTSRCSDPRKLNEFLGQMESCAEHAPDRTYAEARGIVDLVGELADRLMEGLRELQLDADNADRIREVEAVIYGYIRDCNPENAALCEGFGSATMGAELSVFHADRQLADRVIRQATAERDFMESIRPSERQFGVDLDGYAFDLA